MDDDKDDEQTNDPTTDAIYALSIVLTATLSQLVDSKAIDTERLIQTLEVLNGPDISNKHGRGRVFKALVDSFVVTLRRKLDE